MKPLDNKKDFFEQAKDIAAKDDIKITTLEFPRDMEPCEALKTGATEVGKASVSSVQPSNSAMLGTSNYNKSTIFEEQLVVPTRLFNEAEQAVFDKSTKNYNSQDFIDNTYGFSADKYTIADDIKNGGVTEQANINSDNTVSVDEVDEFVVPKTYASGGGSVEYSMAVEGDNLENAGDVIIAGEQANSDELIEEAGEMLRKSQQLLESSGAGSDSEVGQDSGDDVVDGFADAGYDNIDALENSDDNIENADCITHNTQEGMTIAIIGLGLIGGSLGRAFVKRTNHVVLGKDVDKKIERTARLVKAIHAPVCDESIGMVDVVIFATNPRTTIDLLPKYVPLLKDGAIVLDVGGVKQNVFDAMQVLSEKHRTLEFVGTHPMAGREVSGLKYSLSTLFDGASIILTNINAGEGTCLTLEHLFEDIGFDRVVWSEPCEHDKIIAYTSQAAHAVSAAFCLNSLVDKHKGFSAGSFKDLTRVAKLEPDMWTELFCDNAVNLGTTLGEFIDTLKTLKYAVETGDEQAVKDFLIAASLQKAKI